MHLLPGNQVPLLMMPLGILSDPFVPLGALWRTQGSPGMLYGGPKKALGGFMPFIEWQKDTLRKPRNLRLESCTTNHDCIHLPDFGDISVHNP